MTRDEMKNKISMALKDPILQQGFEIICKNLAELEKENEKLMQMLASSADCETCKHYDEDMKTSKELYEDSLQFAYERYPWRVTVASESYRAGYKAAIKETKNLIQSKQKYKRRRKETKE